MMKRIEPEKFARLGKYQKLEVIYSTQFNILEQIGVLKAQGEQLLAYYGGMKEQMDILANQQFMTATIKEFMETLQNPAEVQKLLTQAQKEVDKMTAEKPSEGKRNE